MRLTGVPRGMEQPVCCVGIGLTSVCIVFCCIPLEKVVQGRKLSPKNSDLMSSVLPAGYHRVPEVFWCN